MKYNDGPYGQKGKAKMIIDLILDRRDNERQIAQGYTHYRDWNGRPVPLAYNPKKFYQGVAGYGDIGNDITRAMDSGTENDVKAALCDYILTQDYDPAICGFIHSVNWIE